MTKRNSSIEFLRIISMFLIVLHHYAVHGTFNCMQYSDTYRDTLKVNLCLNFLGKLGVVLFVMIGAFFLCEKRFNFRRPIALIINMLFYSFGIYLLLPYFIGGSSQELESIDKVWLPFPLPSGYWFLYAYIFMLLMMPCLNLIIRNFSRKKLLLIIACLFILWSLIPTGLEIFKGKMDTSPDYFGYSVGGYFVFIYLVAAYIRKYSRFLTSNIKVIIATMLLMICIGFGIFSLHNSYGYNILFAFCQVNSPLVIIFAGLVFSIFKNITFHSLPINFISKSMFGVYLIHEDSFIRPIIWQQFISSQKYASSPLLYFTAGIKYSFLIFCVCIIIDILIRRLLFSKLIDKLSNYLANKMAVLMQLKE